VNAPADKAPPKAKRPNLVSKPVGYGAAIIALVAGAIAIDEGLVNQTYNDIAGIPTVCYGHTGRDVHAGDIKTDAQCEQLLYDDAANHLRSVYFCIHVPLTDNQAAALLRFTYNVGESQLCRSTLARLANAGEPARVWCPQISRYNKARINGVLTPIAGLTKRRAEERALCEKK
jgi:lysozyme